MRRTRDQKTWHRSWLIDAKFALGSVHPVDVRRTADVQREILTVTIKKMSVTSDVMPFSQVKVKHVALSSGSKRNQDLFSCSAYPWRWGWHDPLENLKTFSTLDSEVSQKTEFFNVATSPELESVYMHV
jgi:hypothetical protein